LALYSRLFAFTSLDAKTAGGCLLVFMRKNLFISIRILCSFCAACIFFFPSQAGAAEDMKGVLLPGSKGILVRDNRISLNVRDADIAAVLKEIAQKAKIDVTLGAGVTGKIRMKLTDATIEDALKALCKNRALIYEYLPDKKAFRIIRAAAYLTSTAKEGIRADKHRPYGSEPDQPPSKTLSERKTKYTGIRLSQKDSGREDDTPTRPRYKPGELLVKFKPGLTDQQADALHQSIGSTVIGKIERLRLQRVKLRKGLSEQAAMALYTASEIVEQVEKHALRYPNTIPDDTYFNQQWGPTKIQAPQAWDVIQGSPEVIVAVIDTGVDYQHPDLTDNIWINTAELNGLPGVDDDNNGYIDDIRGWDFAGNDENNPLPDSDPMDVDGHGTHVAGIIAAEGNNGLGITGINWQAKIMVLKVEADNGIYFEDFAIIQAIEYAIDNGAKIINCSFGGEQSSGIEENAFAGLKNAGIFAVCAAGNDGLDTDVTGQEYFPSGYDLENIISVAASDQNDNLAGFSNYGLTSVDVMAPGVDIYSTLASDTDTEAVVKVEGWLEYAAIGMQYAGTTDENGIARTVYFCGLGYLADFPAEVNGNIALIERGELFFSEKTTNAQSKGAVAVIIYNNVVDFLDVDGGTLGDPGDWVPVVSITKTDGEALKALGAPNVTLINKPVDSPSFYGTKNGTSMAAPHVSGVAGLILAQYPFVEYAKIKSALLNTVDNLPAVADIIASGGRVNAYAALKGVFMPGDLSGDSRIGLDDAILALQVLARLNPQMASLCLSCGNDVNGDGRVGSEEAVFVLQVLAGIRE